MFTGLFPGYGGSGGGGSGDFLADGSVPMTGPLDLGGNQINNAAWLDSPGGGNAYFTLEGDGAGEWLDFGLVTEGKRVVLDSTGFSLQPGTSLLSLKAGSGPTNYERAFVRWNVNVFEIGAEKGGTGLNRELRLLAGGNGFAIDPNGGELLSLNHGIVTRPAYSFDIGGNRAYGIWYGSGGVRTSVNGVEKFAVTSVGIQGAPTTSGAVSALVGFKYQVLNRTSSVQENSQSQFGLITNAGAGAATTSTLVSAAEGFVEEFCDNNATHRLTVVPASGDQIIWVDGTVVSAATGSIVATARYNQFKVKALDATTWVASEVVGTWTVTP